MFTAETTGDEVVKTFAAEAHGKTVLITGPSEGGIGAQTAIFLAAGKPKLIILAGRSIAKIQPVIDEIKTKDPDVKVTFVQVDLADISSVRTAASTVNSQVEKLDVLINNAGSMLINPS
jgi:NADP-dependent 3-hydroxy acid dehydrogenase YdfG